MGLAPVFLLSICLGIAAKKKVREDGSCCAVTWPDRAQNLLSILEGKLSSAATHNL